MLRYRSDDCSPLVPHSYPCWVRLFLFFIGIIAFLFVPYFVLCELPKRLKIIVKIENAKKCLSNKEYIQAIIAYIDLIEEHPNYHEGKIKLIQATFSLIDPLVEDDLCFQIGMTYLLELSFSKDDLKDLYACLPETYKQKFLKKLDKI